MIRPSTVLWSAAVIVVGYAMFQVKYEVMQQKRELAHINRQIADSREAIRVLRAEWSFLNQPARLGLLSKRYLNLVPIEAAQLGHISAIPLRQTATAAVSVPAPAPAAITPPPSARRGPELAHLEVSRLP